MEKLRFEHDKFLNSLRALSRSINSFERTDIPEDIKPDLSASLIKHYELCNETAWKFLKIYLLCRFGLEINGPKNIYRESFVQKLIDEDTTRELLNIYEARNSTSHKYDQENAGEICKRVKDYYQTFKKLEEIK